MSKTLSLQEAIKKYPLGFTYDPIKTRLVNKKTGYFVSITDNKLSATEPLSQQTFRLLKAHNALQGMMPDVKLYIGGWTNKHGAKYVDFSIHVKEEHQASILVEVFKQDCYFNCSA